MIVATSRVPHLQSYLFIRRYDEIVKFSLDEKASTYNILLNVVVMFYSFPFLAL
nr:MAG TPA: hypothetical protein [Caudoviricetes sp.]